MSDDPERAALRAAIQSSAEKTFGDPAKASRWLRRPLGVLDGQSPWTVAQTEAGARLIENILAKIAWGAAA
jgi:putative toxin-antitoxin system antitoxin component (TIGR02293 family)